MLLKFRTGKVRWRSTGVGGAEDVFILQKVALRTLYVIIHCVYVFLDSSVSASRALRKYKSLLGTARQRFCGPHLCTVDAKEGKIVRWEATANSAHDNICHSLSKQKTSHASLFYSFWNWLLSRNMQREWCEIDPWTSDLYPFLVDRHGSRPPGIWKTVDFNSCPEMFQKCFSGIRLIHRHHVAENCHRKTWTESLEDKRSWRVVLLNLTQSHASFITRSHARSGKAQNMRFLFHIFLLGNRGSLHLGQGDLPQQNLILYPPTIQCTCTNPNKLARDFGNPKNMKAVPTSRHRKLF